MSELLTEMFLRSWFKSYLSGMVCNGVYLRLHLFSVCSCECGEVNVLWTQNTTGVYVNIKLFMCLWVYICVTAGMGTEVNPSTAVCLSSLALIHPHGKKTPRSLLHAAVHFFFFVLSSPSSLSSGLSSGRKTNPCSLNHSLKSFNLQYWRSTGDTRHVEILRYKQLPAGSEPL